MASVDEVAVQGAATRILSSRALRDFGDGYIAILLPVYLSALGFGAIEIGIIATAALSGSALLTFLIGLMGGRHDLRRLLVTASALMVITGIALSVAQDFAFIVLVAFAGTANPSAGSVSIFVPLEHAVIAGSVRNTERTRIFSRYSFVGAFASALGSLAAASPDLLGSGA